MTLQSIMHVQTGRDGMVSRRGFLRNIGAGAAGLGLLGWKDAVALNAQELRRRDMACIFLFMVGGPSQFETFDPKPGAATGGPTRAIPTAVNGIQIAEHWPNVARNLRDVALIRSMVGREPDHPRALYHLHTGYQQLGGVRYPSIGSIVASEIALRGVELPSFVSVSQRLSTFGSGFLGMSHAPFIVANPTQMPTNAALPVDIGSARFDRRYDLLHEVEQAYAQDGGQNRVRDHEALSASAARMIRSPRLRAFDIAQETDAVRDCYGRTPFGSGCLLARRLVEAGVTFVEVQSGGWDTHADNFNRSRDLSRTVDPAFAALIEDLRDRGRLDRTLIVWVGEFGRTPTINGNTGRDHFQRAFSAALAGGGIRGGRVVGATSATGTDVTDRPVPVNDFFRTICQALGIDANKENLTTIGRPVRLVEGGQPIRELFS